MKSDLHCFIPKLTFSDYSSSDYPLPALIARPYVSVSFEPFFAARQFTLPANSQRALGIKAKTGSMRRHSCAS
jgi:hypothetical protein